jgi:hypothetical protein
MAVSSYRLPTLAGVNHAAIHSSIVSGAQDMCCLVYKDVLSLGTRADKSRLRERFLVMLCIRSSITCSRLNVIGRDPNAHIDGDDRSKRLERISGRRSRL